MPPTFFIKKIGAFLRALPVALCILSVLATGCTNRNKTQPIAKYRQDPPEMMTEYTPRDDGQPLTSDELYAFKTVSELDRGLSEEEARIVELHFKYFVHQRRTTFARYIERTARYLPYIKKTFVDRGIPEDISYLAMVESGGNPNAISPVGATGLWQFMPYTGRSFGLQQNKWVDERRDPFKATYAASDYLLKLYNDFSNWHLAVAAYNAGEGKIGRAVSGTGAKDFFDLCRLDSVLDEKARLRTETRDYVPRLIAMAKIMRNLDRLGFQQPSPEAAYNLATISIPAGTNLSGLARSLDLTWDEFSAMNPAYKLTASPPGIATTGYVPPEKMASASQWLAGNEARMYADWAHYKVRRGDTLASIARRNKISVASLKDANSLSSNPRVGTTIMIPGKSAASEPVYAALPQSEYSASASAGKYTVRSGDSLFSLARDWGTDVESIRLANRMSSKDTLKLGQRLSIPGNSKKVTPAQRSTGGMASPAPATRHTVSKGDSAYSIARQYGISTLALCSANGLDAKKPKIRIGQKLTIPAKGGATPTPAAAAPARAATRAATQQARPASAQQAQAKPAATKPASAQQQKPAATKPATAKARVVTVKSGISLYSIAKEHNTSVKALQKANGLGNSTKLKVGQKITIP